MAERAADQIRRRILLGDVRPGARLESSRTLSQELGVSLPVVREALAGLRAIGLIDVRQGAGVFVARRPRTASSLRASKRRATRRELHQLRRALEGVAAGAAAHQATSHRKREIRLALEERARGRLSGDPDRFTDADLELHVGVTQATGNALAVSLHRMACVGLRSDFVGMSRRLADDHRLDRLHAALVDAIEAGRHRVASRTATAIATIEAGDRPP